MCLLICTNFKTSLYDYVIFYCMKALKVNLVAKDLKHETLVVVVVVVVAV